MAKRRKLPKKFRARSVSDEEKLEEARRRHRAAQTVVFRAVGKLAEAHELVCHYERKLGVDLKASSRRGLVELARVEVKKGARSWLENFGFNVPEAGGEPTTKAP